MDTAGKVVIADDTASVLMGVPASTPAVDPTVRWNPGLPELIGAARYASRQAARNPDWVGSTQIFTHLADEPTSISIRPVFSSGHLIGNLVSFGASDGAQLPQAEGSAHPRVQPRRLVAMRDNRMVLLRLPEVSFAESEGNDVWLSTDQGRLRAASQGLDKLDGELADAGFLRVHRRYVVNLSRIREIERGLKGELSLVMDDRTNDDGAGLPAERAGRAPRAGHLSSQHNLREDSRVRQPGRRGRRDERGERGRPRPPRLGRAPRSPDPGREQPRLVAEPAQPDDPPEAPRRGRPHGRGLRLRRGVPDPRPRRPGAATSTRC